MVLTAALAVAPAAAAETDGLATEALAQLNEALTSQPRWIKVHAAEALLELGYRDEVHSVFLDQQQRHGNDPEYRIGIWRVLAQASDAPSEQTKWTEQIAAALLDRDGPDRIHAAESLAKLGGVSDEQVREALAEAANSQDAALALFANWALAVSGDADRRGAVLRALTDDDPIMRLRAGAILGRTDSLTPQERSRLEEAARGEPDGSIARSPLIGALFIHAAAAEDGEQLAWSRAALSRLLGDGDPTTRRFALAALAERGVLDDLETVAPLLSDSDPDVRVSAAAATLRLARRQGHRLATSDWAVIVVYVLGMIGIGWYYSRRAATTEDYLLGGRTMKPWAVGLSLFATLLSTISYLAIPGEMIQHGPMIISQVLVFPLIFVVVGYLLIPRFMQLEATSANELLETRLGVEVRTLGAVFFLAMRLFWMAVIIYATTDKVLIPLLDWPAWSTPYACAVLGAITVTYTSLGGIRAVVITDVVQTGVLLLGAAISMALITMDQGGVDGWWPTEWTATWDPPKFWFDPGARSTVSTVLLSVFVWHVCTAGSDQMAVQRYLSTHDVSAARRMFATSLGVNAVALTLLALLGLALLAFFRDHPDLLSDGQTVETHADQLLPRFILIGLPQGLSGLVVAALLAAAMSSLSSGINSACSIVTVDFLDRFRPQQANGETDHLRRTAMISWILGVVVVSLSSATAWVPGNLLEVTFRVVNLLTAPLFVLFFMAMFVPWATTYGVLGGAILSVAVAVGIAFYELGNLSFFWIIPGSFIVGVGSGMVLSLVPGTESRFERVDGWR